MNKLIEQLTIEAFFDEVTNGSGQKMYTFGEEKMQKFAELIVLECSRIGELKEQGSVEYDPDVSVGHYMRQHFGVE